MFAPVVIFAYNRPEQFRRLLDTLKRNNNFDKHEVFIYIDGPKQEYDAPLVEEVKNIAKGFASNLIVAEKNKGLAQSVIEGVTEVIEKFGRVIVLEDDLILHPEFLDYMDHYLELFVSDRRVISICGYGLKIKKPVNYPYNVYFSLRSSSWGWATWADRWNNVDWDVATFPQIQYSKVQRNAFNRAGSDMYGMLKGNREGKNNSWAIRFCYEQFRRGQYSVHPFRSLVSNEGYGSEATNCRQKYNRFKTDLLPFDEPAPIEWPAGIELNEEVTTANRHYHSIPRRLYSLLRRVLNI